MRKKFSQRGIAILVAALLFVSTATTALAGSNPTAETANGVTEAQTLDTTGISPSEGEGAASAEEETPAAEPAEEETVGVTEDATEPSAAEEPAGEAGEPTVGAAVPAGEGTTEPEQSGEPVADAEPTEGLAGEPAPQEDPTPIRLDDGYVVVSKVNLIINGVTWDSSVPYVVQPNEDVYVIVEYNWKIADNITDEQIQAINPGDSVSLGVFPAGLPIDYSDIYSLSIPLTNGKTLIATVTFDPATGEMILTFEGEGDTAAVNGMTNIGGTIRIYSEITHFTSEVPGETVKFNDEDESTYYFEFPAPTDAATVTKTALNTGKNGTIDWRVDINTEEAKGAPSTVTDTILTGGGYGNHAFTSTDDIKVYKLNVTYGEGGSITQGELLGDGDYTVALNQDGSGYTVTIGDSGTIDGAYRIIATSHYDYYDIAADDNFTYNGSSAASITFGNKATYNDKSDTADKTEPLPQLYGKKFVKYVKDATSGLEYLEWTVVVNAGKGDTGNGSVAFKDVLSGGGHVFDTGGKLAVAGITAYTLQLNGSGSNLWNNPAHMSTPTVTGDSLSFDFTNLSGNSYTLTIRTLVDPQGMDRTSSVKANNTMTYTVAGKDYSAAAETTVNAYSPVKPTLTKAVTNSSASIKDDGKISWKITATPGDYGVAGMSNVTITDTLKSLYTGSQYIQDLDAVESSFKVKVGNEDLIRDVHYTLNLIENGTNGLPEFTITFIGDYAKLKDTAIITYDTTYDGWGDISTDGRTIYGGKFENTAVMTFDEDTTTTYKAAATETIPDRKVTDSKTGAKVDYDNQEITWQLKMNLSDYLDFGISNLVITDTLTPRDANLNLPYNLPLGEDFTVSIKDGSGTVDPDLYRLDFDKDGYTFTVTFDNAYVPNGEIVITYVTKFSYGDTIADPVAGADGKTYTTLLGGTLGNKYTIDFDLGNNNPGWGHGSGSGKHVTIENGGEVKVNGKQVSSEKTGVLNAEKTQIKWTIIVDPKDYKGTGDINSIIITDEITDPSGTAKVSSLDLKAENFTIKDNNTEVDPANYTLQVSGKTFTLDFEKNYTPTGVITVEYISELVWEDPVADITSPNNGTTFGGTFKNKANVQFKLKDSTVNIPLNREVKVGDKTVKTDKGVAANGINVQEKKITWEITVDPNTYTNKEMNSLVLTDTLRDGTGDIQTLPLGDNFKVKVTDRGTTLTEGQEYTLVYDPTDYTFTIIFEENYSPNGVIKVTYDSYFEWVKSTVVDQYGNAIDSESFNQFVLGGTIDNTVDISFKLGETPVSFEEQATAPIPPQKIDIIKTGKYDSKTGNFNWKVSFNSNKVYRGDDVTLTDTFGTDPAHKLIRDSLKVRKNGVDITNDTTAYTFAYLQTNGQDDPTKGFVLTFADGNAAYEVEFQTEATSQLKNDAKYENTALLTSGQLKAQDNADAIVKDQSDGSDLSKTATSSEGGRDGDLDWVLTLNSEQRTLKEAVLTDTASRGLEVDRNSIVVKAGTNVLEKDVDYDLEFVGSHLDGDHNYTTTIIVTFKGDYTSFNDIITITYKTSLYLPNALNTNGKPVLDYGGTVKVFNHAVLTGLNVLGSTTVTNTEKKINATGEATAYPMKVKILKTDSETGATLKGAEFNLWNADRTFVVKSVVVGDDGIGLLGEILTGSYWLEETKAPEGYYLANDPEDRFQQYKVNSKDTVNDEGYAVYNIENDRLYSVQALKLSAEEPDAPGGEGLAGAEFTLTNENTGVMWENLTTDSDGYTQIVKVTAGTYTFTETKAPDGYELTGTYTVTFNVGQNYKEGTNDVIVTEEEDGFYSYVAQFENLLTRFQIQIFKQDFETQEALAGAEFEVTDKATGQKMGTITTGADGTASLGGLKKGTYTVTETKQPTNYYMPQNNSFDMVLPGNANEDHVVSYTIKNTAKEYTLRIFKHDAESTGTALSGAEFQVTDSNNKSVGKITIGSNGYGSLSGLAAGVYTVTETKAPGGYELDTTPKTITLDDLQLGSNDVITVNVANSKIPLYSIQVNKYDNDTSDALAGAQFSVTNSNGSSVGNIVTVSNGTGTLSGLPAGTYTVTETQAPTGYVLSAASHTVTLPAGAASNGVVAIDVPNTAQTYTLNVYKSDSGTGAPLAGAQFRIADGNDTTVGTITTLVSGFATLTGLAADTYTVQEISAPVGYILDDTVQTVTLPDATTGGSMMITMTNDPVPVGVPLIVVPAAVPPVAPVAPVVVGPVTITGDNTPLDTIIPDEVPLGGLGINDAWSLLNLIMSLIALFSSIILFITIFTRRSRKKDDKKDENEPQTVEDKQEKQEEEEEQQIIRRRLMAFRLPAILLGLIPGILFLILENIRLPVTWITQWTPIIGAFFIITMAVVIVHFAIRKREKDKNKDDEDDNKQRPQAV